MQLQEGSTISINCAVCGRETFQVTLLRGVQVLPCTKINTNYHTVVSVKKAENGDLNVESWKR